MEKNTDEKIIPHSDSNEHAEGHSDAETGMKLLVDKVLESLPDIPEAQKRKQGDILLKVLTGEVTARKAMGFSDETLEALYSSGYRYYNSGNYKSAIKIFAALSMLESTDARFSLAVGACLQKMGKLPEAIEAYYAAAVLDPMDPLPTFYSYHCYLKQKDYFGAYVMLDNTIRRLTFAPGKNQVLEKMLARCQFLIKGLEDEHPEVLSEMSDMQASIKASLEQAQKDADKDQKSGRFPEEIRRAAGL